ncbi:hypothetical protein D9M68_851130 [compost metagenome]
MNTITSGSRLAQPITSPPGCTTSSAPAKPPHTSTQRSGDTRSRRNSAASSVTTSGVIMTMAVNSPTGMYCRATNEIALTASSKAPRNTWKRGWAVCSRLRPRNGSMTAVTNTAWNA